jgi:hypothetical protein
MKSTEPTPNALGLTEPAIGPLRLPDCDDPKSCICLRDCNLFRPPPDFVRPVAADATPRERLEASTWFDLLPESTVAAYRGREDLLLPRPTPIVRIGVDPPQYPCELREPTLDEMAAVEDLVDRALAISVNPHYSPCEPWRMLVESVKGTFPFGFAVQAYLSPLPEPSPKIYRRSRPYVTPPWLLNHPTLFDAFGVELPDCPPPESYLTTMRKIRDREAQRLMTRALNGGAAEPASEDIPEDRRHGATPQNC